MKQERKIEIDFKKPELNLGTDLIPYETKVSKSFHGQISSSVAEERLRFVNADRCYLTRESDVEAGKYVLSCLVNGTVIHYSVPIATYHKLISANFKHDNCQLPVYRPDTDEKHATTTYPKHTCYVCALQLNTAKEKQFHMKCHRLYECKFCNKYYPDTNFSKHTKKCSPEKHYFECQVCDYRTLQNHQMKRHMKLHEMKPLLCKLCLKRFPNDEILQRHKTFLCGKDKNITGFGKDKICNLCDKPVSYKGIDRHIKDMHKDSYVKKIRKIGRTKHECPYPKCDFKSESRKRFLRHKNWRHVEKIPKSPLKCDGYGCDYSHVFASQLKRHRQTCKKSEEVIMFM